jgi:hypothetical protein
VCIQVQSSLLRVQREENNWTGKSWEGNDEENLSKQRFIYRGTAKKKNL